MAIPTYSTGDPILDFFFTLFNGIAEVPLFSSPITGILILAGVFIASRKAGAMMVLSGLIGAGMLFWLGLLMTWSLSVCSVTTQYSLEWHFGQGRLLSQIGPLSLSQCLGRL